MLLKSKFKDQISDTSVNVSLLPIVHSCSAYSFRSIIDARELKPSYCNVFNEPYLYSYYGIPSYRQMTNGASGNPAYFPVCFVFNYLHVPKLKRLHPFDTGAFVKLTEFRERYFHPRMNLNDFELDPNIDDAKKVISRFFMSNGNYIARKIIKHHHEVDPLNFEEYSYVQMLEDESKGELDNRVATIELIHDKGIPLTNKSLSHVILPGIFLDNEDLKRILSDDLGIQDPGTYQTFTGNPNEFTGVILNQYLKLVDELK